MLTWPEVAPGIHVATLPDAEMNSVAIASAREVFVVDVGGSPVRGAELRADVERRFGQVVGVAITHSHWDHCFGLEAFSDVDTYAHGAAIVDLRETGTMQRDMLLTQHEGPADLSPDFTPFLPAHTVDRPTVLRVGSLDVALEPIGHAHSLGDLVVHIRASGASIVGDLIEIGARPQLHDASLEGWLAALDRLAEIAEGVIVPGHGAVSDRSVIDEHRAMFAAAIAHIRGDGPAPDQLDLTELPTL